MNASLLTSLQCIKAICTGAISSADAATAGQLAVASRLLDHLCTEARQGGPLKARVYAQVEALLPRLEALSATAGSLRARCAAADPADFPGFLLELAGAQRNLLANGNDNAVELAKALTAIEVDYHRDFHAAVLQQTQLKPVSGGAALAARNAREVDTRALQDFLRKCFPDEPALEIAGHTVIAGGYSKFTIGVRLKGVRALPAEVILRADAGGTFGGVSAVEEYQLLQILHRHGVQVPRPLAVEPTGSIFGTPFMLVEKMPGASIGHMFMLPQPNAAVCRDVAAQLARIHRIPVAEFGDRITNAKGRNSDQARAWIAEGLKSWRPLGMPSTVFEAAFDFLQRHAELNDRAPRAFVHGDVHLANILVQDNRLSTILDWEFAHIGNSAYDLGYFYDQAVALDSWESFLETYRQAGGIDHPPEQLDYAILFAATRLGVMVCQSESAFVSGAEPGLAGAAVLAHNFYDMTVNRIGRVLERLL